MVTATERTIHFTHTHHNICLLAFIREIGPYKVYPTENDAPHADSRRVSARYMRTRLGHLTVIFAANRFCDSESNCSLL